MRRLSLPFAGRALDFAPLSVFFRRHQALPIFVWVLYPEGLPDGLKAVSFPEAQDFESFLGVFGGHLPKMPQLRYPVIPPNSVSNVLNPHGAPSSTKECQRFLNLCRFRGVS